MSKKEKLFWLLAYATTLLLTLLPFFQVGLTNTDDFQYYNTSHFPGQWVFDATVYAHGAGRFYFLLTKYFYYVPYLFDNYALTKFIQYFTTACSYALFSFLVYKIFRSKRLGALTGLLLIFNMSLGIDNFYPPTSFPFYFHFSLIIFLAGLLLYVNYCEKGGYWRVIISAALVLLACLFYENYILFSVFFIIFVIVKEWCRNGFVAMMKSKEFYKRLCPFVAVVALYMACYIGYRHYVTSHFENAANYSGSLLSSDFSWSNFFDILVTYTTYTLPGWIFSFRDVQATLASNSPLITGHYNNVWFVLTHAPAIAYINALIQCGMLWYLMKKADFKNMSWIRIFVGIAVALVVAFFSHTLIAVSEKFNSGLYPMRGYVTSLYSYFCIVLAIAILVVMSLKLLKNEKARSVAVAVWCVLLACYSIHHSYANDLLSKEWKKSQNRMIVMDLVAEEELFDKIPENSIIYIESLLNTSRVGWGVAGNDSDFPKFINRVADKKYIYGINWDDLKEEITLHPESEVYFLQVSETKKNCETLFAFSHISRMGDQLSSTEADEADVYYYSPTKDYILFYGIRDADATVRYKALNVRTDDLHKELTHVNIHEEHLCPMRFRISNME